MNWRAANSLLVLRDQINALHPDRNKADDGLIGDARHRREVSDHNPVNGVVHALDLTHDPAHHFDSYVFAETLRLNRDHRLKYVISNRRIWSPSISRDWRPYHGSDPHTGHVHISVVGDNKLADDKTPWKMDRPAPVSPAEEIA